MVDMKSKNTLKVGDTVKSLDWAHSNDNYCVGVITSIDEVNCTFTAQMTEHVVNGESLYLSPWSDNTFCAPLPGFHMFEDEWCEPRVQVVA